MFKKEVRIHFLATIGWLTLISLLRWEWEMSLIFLWLGGLIGAFLLDIDHFFYTIIIYPQELTSMRAARLIKQRNFRGCLILLADTREERFKLVFHNALFQVIFYFFCFFVLTSTTSLFGAGLVMSMSLHLLKDEAGLLLAGKEEFLRKMLFWQIKNDVSFSQQKLFVILMFLIFLGLNLWLV